MEKKKKEIQQSNNEVIIHQNIARLRGRLTTVQSRSMLSILKRANDAVSIDPDLKEFTIPTEIFLNDIVITKETRGHKTVVKAVSSHLEKLMIQIFEWGTMDKPKKAVFMQEIAITEKEVSFKFSDYIREHIKPISNVLIVRDFALMQSFRSEYARQLYKHLMLWEKKQTCYLSLKDLKDFLGVPQTKTYERMDNFKRKVLDIAVLEINEKRKNMDLRYFPKKNGRNIIGFTFGWIFIKENKESLFNEDELKSEFIDYIGKFIGNSSNNDDKILSITPFDNPTKYKVSTPAGEHIYPNIELLRFQIEDINNSSSFL